MQVWLKGWAMSYKIASDSLICQKPVLKHLKKLYKKLTSCLNIRSNRNHFITNGFFWAVYLAKNLQNHTQNSEAQLLWSRFWHSLDADFAISDIKFRVSLDSNWLKKARRRVKNNLWNARKFYAFFQSDPWDKKDRWSVRKTSGIWGIRYVHRAY